MTDALKNALKRFDDHMELIGGCTDGGCVIVRPKGMHTNGGCKCPRDQVKMQRAMFAALNLRNAVAAAGASEAFPYQKTFNAIAAATSIEGGHIAISVRKFIESFGAVGASSDDVRDAFKKWWTGDVISQAVDVEWTDEVCELAFAAGYRAAIAKDSK